MSGMTDSLRRAIDEFDRRVVAVSDDQWTDPTPCSDWNVRDLVNHVTAEVLWASLLLDGRTLEEVGDRFDGDVLGGDPIGTWSRARQGTLDALNESMVSDVHTSMGQIDTDEYLGQLLADHLIHAWDLARGIGADETLDPELVSLCHRLSLPAADLMAASGLFGSQVVPPAGSGPQVRLLALYGRRA
ncbi:MAG: TIGR03086 family metal-binding protein [Acidimicrobiia bacterium]